MTKPGVDPLGGKVVVMLIPVLACPANARRSAQMHPSITRLFLVIVLSTVPGHASQPATVAGQLSVEGGAPLAGATVTLFWGKQPSIVWSTVTGPDGSYSFTGLVPRSGYVILADLEGYASVEVSPVDLAPGASSRQNIKLWQDAPEAMIAGRWVRGDEFAEYALLNKKIADATAKENLGTLTPIAVKRLFAAIEELSDFVNEDVRSYLRYQIADCLEALPATHVIIYDLLATGDSTLHQPAISILLNHAEPWEEDSKMTDLLKEVLLARDSDVSVRSGILLLFASRDAFHEVEQWADRWARDDHGGGLAREAARMIAWNAGLNRSLDDVVKLFHDSEGILREEAALALEGHFPPWEIPGDTRAKLLTELRRMIRDPAVLLETKGDALIALWGFRADPRTIDALILDGLEHPDPDLCPSLLKLRGDLHLLEAGLRGQVEALLRAALRRCANAEN